MEITANKSFQRLRDGVKFTAFSLLIILSYNTCTEEPTTPEEPPQKEKADCPKGFLSCEEDSTACCEVICPSGTLLGGQDSTECIPVECPDFHYLCGPDSTDCCPDTTSHNMNWEVDTIFTGIVALALDVVIINDTTIWVVGDFCLYDSEDTLSSFEENFNLIRWNGNNWTLD